MTDTVYLDLDALLDTRLAVVSSIDQQAAAKLVTSEEYFTRDTDDFSAITGIPHERYLEEWSKRNVSHLARSIKTHIPLLLNELIHKLEVQEEQTPFRQNTDIELNVWPYVDLLPVEREQLCLAIMVHAGIQTIPRVTCFNPKELTPRRIKQGYSGLIMYNLRDWLQHHLEAFEKIGAPDVAVLAPALYNGERPDLASLAHDPDLRTDVSPFSVTEVACAPWFQLNYLDVRHFSIWRP